MDDDDDEAICAEARQSTATAATSTFIVMVAVVGYSTSNVRSAIASSNQATIREKNTTLEITNRDKYHGPTGNDGDPQQLTNPRTPD